MLSRIITHNMRFHRRCISELPRVIASAAVEIPIHTGYAFQKSFATSQALNPATRKASPSLVQLYNDDASSPNLKKQQRHLPNHKSETTKAFIDPKVTVSIVSAEDPDAREGLEFIRREASKDVSVHEEQAHTTYVLTGRDVEDGRIVAACFFEIYDVQDLCNNNNGGSSSIDEEPSGPAALLEHSNCPTFARPYVGEIASILAKHSGPAGAGRIFYGCTLSFAKDVRGGNLQAQIGAELFQWALTKQKVTVFCQISGLSVMSKFWYGMGYRPLGPAGMVPKLVSAHGVPQDRMAIPNALLLSDIPYLEQVNPQLAHPLKRMGVSNPHVLQALHDAFPLLASNEVSGAANLRKLQGAAASAEELSSCGDDPHIWQALDPEDLAKMLNGGMEVAIKAGDSLELERDISPKDCLLLLSGEVTTTSVSSGTSVVPLGGIVYRASGEGSNAISEIVATKDSRLLMLSSKGAKQFGLALDETAAMPNEVDVAV